MYKTQELFDLEHTLAKEYLLGFTYPYECLENLTAFIYELGKTLTQGYVRICDGVWVHESASVAPTAYLGAPCIIGARTQIRHGAYIRGGALIGDDCVVGNSVEIKNAVLLDGAQVPHFNYVGDSVIGYKAHLGAGVITSNVKSDKTLVVCVDGTEKIKTGRKKVGAMVGDYVEIGCNSVLNPGTIVGRRAQVYPLSCVRGTVRENCIYKNAKEIVERR